MQLVIYSCIVIGTSLETEFASFHLHIQLMIKPQSYKGDDHYGSITFHRSSKREGFYFFMIWLTACFLTSLDIFASIRLSSSSAIFSRSFL
mmetsp:Transcript_14018/g.25352  ORF Transcript_14018/g.25352 Transcript_14018/m.25352 type:complete len:91 (-) Transcript_14018:654-926(-)